MHLCFPSCCNIVASDGLVLVLYFMIEGKLACIRFPLWFIVVFNNALALVLEGKLEHASFLSWYDVLVDNEPIVVFSFMMHGNITCVIFPLQCNVVFGNALVRLL